MGNTVCLWRITDTVCALLCLFVIKYFKPYKSDIFVIGPFVSHSYAHNFCVLINKNHKTYQDYFMGIG